MNSNLTCGTSIGVRSAGRIVTIVDCYLESDVDVNESLTIVQFLKKCSVFETFSPTLLAQWEKSYIVEYVGKNIIDINARFYGDNFPSFLHWRADNLASYISS